MVTVGVELVGTLFDLIVGSYTWLTVASSLVGLVLLVLPVTRRYVRARAVIARA
jgi:F0F1-type ATP synthase assembly protein I